MFDRKTLWVGSEQFSQGSRSFIPRASPCQRRRTRCSCWYSYAILRRGGLACVLSKNIRPDWPQRRPTRVSSPRCRSPEKKQNSLWACVLSALPGGKSDVVCTSGTWRRCRSALCKTRHSFLAFLFARLLCHASSMLSNARCTL